MACLGVHFALAEEDVTALRDIEDEDERLSYLQENIEGRYLAEPVDYAAESDKAWDAMHRVLADGLLTWDGGNYPLNHAVLAGELLYTSSGYIMSLKTPTQVVEIAAALDLLSETDFRAKYYSIPANDYCDELSEKDLAYTWHWFQNVRKLFRIAANQNRHVLFTADQ